jgi:hypothetical protein
MEEVGRVVAVFHLHQARVVVAVGRLDALLPFIHHKVDICAAGREGVQRLPVCDRPILDRRRVGRVGVDTNDHLGPARVAVAEGGDVA